MDSGGERKKKILDLVSQKNALVDKEALEALKTRDDWKELLEELFGENVFFIRREDIEPKITKTKLGVVEKGRIETTQAVQRDSEWDFDYRIMRELDITSQSHSNGTIEDFLGLFRDKFISLEKMLKTRHSLAPKPIKRLKTVANKEEVDLIGMVYRKWRTKNGHTALEIEDLESSCIAVLMKDDKALEEARDKLMLDDVIGLKCVKLSNDMVLAKKVFWADLPQKKMKKAKRDVRLACISDLHVGSKLFLEKSFSKFIDWINGRIGSEKEKKEVKKIRYLTVNGDNVDGIGIYPRQFDELNIKNIYEQYKQFSNLMLQIPKTIQIFIIPGQHDAVRWADPQPALPEKLVPKLYEAENIHLLGSPGWIEIEGIKTVMFHGSGLHDLFSNVSGLDYKEPQNAIIELLKKRDLMPAYGLRQPYVAEKKDYMVLREEPDIVLAGDLHHSGYARYRGTLIVNNSTWQDRTDYQVKLGHVPTPGIVPVINLQTGCISEKQFHKGG